MGRVSISFLLNHFNQVDLVEPVKHFIGKAEELLGPNAAPRADGRGGTLVHLST